MVHLTRIYTRTGDGGQTRLVDMSSPTRPIPRVAAYGDVDEANSAIGVALGLGRATGGRGRPCSTVQNELFDVGADLGNPLRRRPSTQPLRVTQDYVDRLEAACDTFGDPLPPTRSFVLPGGSRRPPSCTSREPWSAAPNGPPGSAVERYGPARHHGGLNLLAITYLNRLSDLLFILARAVNGAKRRRRRVVGARRRSQPDRSTKH